MAIVEYSGGINRMSGSIAGHTYGYQHDCNCVRSRTKPVDKNNANQQKIRSAFSGLSTRWAQTLTDEQRADWAAYGDGVTLPNRLGAQVHVYGYQHYLRSNVIRLQSGLPIIDNGPAVMEIPAADPTLAVTVDEFSQEMYVTFNNALDWANEDGGYMFIYQGRPMNHQREFFAGTWRLCNYIEGDAVTPPVSPDPELCVFAVAENQHQFIYARISRADGRLSEQFRSDGFRGESYADGHDLTLVRSDR